MNEIANIDSSAYVTVQGNYAVINKGTGYAIINIQNKQFLARNISSFLDCVKTLEYIASKQDNSSQDYQVYSGVKTPPQGVEKSGTLTGLTEYYPLKGLTSRLISEVENSKDFKNFQSIKTNDKISKNSIRLIQETSQHSQYLSEVVITYYRDHNCSSSEADLLSVELKQLAISLSMIYTVHDLRKFYIVVTLFTHQISRFRHRERKYRWDYLIRKNMLDKLNDCLSENY
ncbi:hypothetical protein ACN4EE_19500 [Geminocystis sp. CENA526]|uniref:hypothetical protein n=1 Tax=Geminocystis sp. CENA526 TaxID=1355871 RepID=UPI003D6EE36A